MIRRAAALVVALVLALSLVACGDPAVPPVAAPTISANLSFTCAEALFPAPALDNPLGAETDDDCPRPPSGVSCRP